MARSALEQHDSWLISRIITYAGLLENLWIENCRILARFPPGDTDWGRSNRNNRLDLRNHWVASLQGEHQEIVKSVVTWTDGIFEVSTKYRDPLVHSARIPQFHHGRVEGEYLYHNGRGRFIDFLDELPDVIDKMTALMLEDVHDAYEHCFQVPHPHMQRAWPCGQTPKTACSLGLEN